MPDDEVTSANCGCGAGDGDGDGDGDEAPLPDELPPPPPDQIAEDLPVLPAEYELGQAFPNPFNPETRIQYSLPRESQVRLRIYNVVGELVATLVDQQQEAGVKTVYWNAGMLSSGVYFYSLEAGSYTETRKMLLMR